MVSPKIVTELPMPTRQTLITDSLSTPKPAKNPKEYKKRDQISEFDQKPISPPVSMASKFLTQTVSLTKTESLPLKSKGTAKDVMDIKTEKGRAERKISLEKQLNENTIKMNAIKKPKMQQIFIYFY